MKRRVLSLAFSSLFLLTALIGLGITSGASTAHASTVSPHDCTDTVRQSQQTTVPHSLGHTTSSSSQTVHPNGNTGGSDLFGEANSGLWKVNIWPPIDPCDGYTPMPYAESFYIQLVFEGTGSNAAGGYDYGSVYIPGSVSSPGTGELMGNYTVTRDTSTMVVQLFDGPQNFKGVLDGRLRLSNANLSRTVGQAPCMDQDGNIGIFSMSQGG